MGISSRLVTTGLSYYGIHRQNSSIQTCFGVSEGPVFPATSKVRNCAGSQKEIVVGAGGGSTPSMFLDSEKNKSLALFRKPWLSMRIPPHCKGRCARSSRHARRGGDGRGNSQQARKSVRTNERLADVKSQGPDTPMLVSARDNASHCTGHGGQQARRTRETAYKREDHRAGKAGCSRLHLWYLPPAFF